MHKQIRDVLSEVHTVTKKIPEITHIGNPVLHTKTSRATVSEARKIAKKLQTALLRYRKATGVGRGIAAPQIGISKSVFVTYVGDMFQVYVNPRMIHASRTQNYFRESCLSARVLWCDVKRPESVTLTWSDERGKKQTKTFVGLEARLVQHEYDHLQGVVCFDRAEKGGIAYCTGDVTKEKLRKVI